MIVIGIDPGRKRCGISVVDSVQGTLKRSLVSSLALMDKLTIYKSDYPDSVIVCGDSASSKDLMKSLNTLNYDVIYIDEKNSTLEGRKLYWKRHKKPWWALLIPKTMLHPKRRIDDYAATVIAKRYIEKYL